MRTSFSLISFHVNLVSVDYQKKPSEFTNRIAHQNRQLTVHDKSNKKSRDYKAFAFCGVTVNHDYTKSMFKKEAQGLNLDREYAPNCI